MTTLCHPRKARPSCFLPSLCLFHDQHFKFIVVQWHSVPCKGYARRQRWLANVACSYGIQALDGFKRQVQSHTLMGRFHIGISGADTRVHEGDDILPTPWSFITHTLIAMRQCISHWSEGSLVRLGMRKLELQQREIVRQSPEVRGLSFWKGTLDSIWVGIYCHHALDDSWRSFRKVSFLGGPSLNNRIEVRVGLGKMLIEQAKTLHR